ncbi:MAG TPA: hypothetical protein G4O03_00275 [Dehalococcoidia bacterium]|nr:hypothetical protein [Dehalococcoidia bacterium]
MWALLAILVLPLLVLQAGQAYPAQSLEAIAQPYRFALARWEASHLLGSLLWGPPAPTAPTPEQFELVRDYFELGRKIKELRIRLELYGLSPEERQALEEELQELKAERAPKQAQVMALLGAQVAEALAEHGLDTRLLWGRIHLLFPPLRFEFDSLPHVLIVSPRERIATISSTLLKPTLSQAEMEEIEAQVAKLGYSGLVEQIGGVATYPSLLADTVSLEDALSTIAHEWTHHFLVFYPLGRHYNASYDMTIINETVADIVGQEIGDALIGLYQTEEERRQEQGAQTEKKPAFDFNKAMRETRLRVDQLLAQGRVEEAERYMEERRLFINAQGYYIRKLNQAYFAFHGSYGESPAATSPIGSQLRALRERSASLGEFVRTVARISSYQELQALLQE